VVYATPMRHAILFAFAAILAAGPVLSAQEQPSLGEIARKYREEKRLREAAASAPSVTQQPAAMNVNVIAVIQPAVDAKSVVVAPVVTLPIAHESVPEMDANLKANIASEAAKRQALTVPAAPMPAPQPPALVVRTAVKTESAPSAKRSAPTAGPVFPTITSGQPARPVLHPSVVPVNNTGSNSPNVTRPVLLQRNPAANTGGTSGPSSSGSSSEEQPAADPGSQMDDIYTSIGQNLQTPEGEKYNSVFAREFSLKNSRGVRECLEHGSKDPGPFDVVVQVSSNGAPQQALIFPDTGATGCLRSTLARAAFSAPPAPGYWVKVTLTNNR
jgi:hypothetical protein